MGYSKSVYLPAPFHETDIPRLHGLMRAHPLATLITQGADGVVADHIPMQVHAAAEAPSAAGLGILRGHVARANPLWRQHPADREALAVFQGPEVYVSPSWYPTKQRTGEVVPTWNYAVMHAYGRIRFIHEREWLLPLVSSLTDTHEAARAAPWQVGDAPSGYIDEMLRAIVGFEIEITRMTGKWKVSQNRDATDRQGVIDGLRAADDRASWEVAELVENKAPPGRP